MNHVIYGAQGIALSSYMALSSKGIDIDCFVVTSKRNNPEVLAERRVIDLEEFTETYSDKEVTIYIATPENLFDEIKKGLSAFKKSTVICLDSVKWADLVKDYYIKMNKYMPLMPVHTVGEASKAVVFRMVHAKDKTLRDKWKRPENSKNFRMLDVQVGSENSHKISGVMHDNEGDSISEKNGDYSELTGLYYAWKNHFKKDLEKADYYGICHYRRVFELNDNELGTLKAENIDAVFPFPLLYEPDIGEHHKRYIGDREWKATLDAVKIIYPDMEVEFKEFLKTNALCNYNLIIAKREVLCEYCEWLFTLLFEIENRVRDDHKPNRYIGYIAETLESFYFLEFRKDLKIVHKKYDFLV